MSLEEDLDYCARELRRLDHDRYLITLMAASEARAPLTALYAFNLEVARTAETVSEPMLGQIRLQWWRESIEGIFEGAARRHAVVQPLAAAIHAYGLPRASFERLIDAREADLLPEPFARREQLLTYAETTGGALENLAVRIAAPDEPEAAALAQRVGRAWALTGLARAVPFMAAQGRVMLPGNDGVRLGELSKGKATQALRECLKGLADLAAEDLQAAREGGKRLSRPAKRQLMLARLAELYLWRLRKSGYDPFTPRVQEAPPGRAWTLLAGRLLGRF